MSLKANIVLYNTASNGNAPASLVACRFYKEARRRRGRTVRQTSITIKNTGNLQGVREFHLLPA